VKKIIIFLLTIALVASAAMLLEKRKQSVKNAPVPIPLSYQVRVVSATMEHLEQTRPFLAQLTSRETVVISSKLSGRIKDVLVSENQEVNEGDLLLQIDDLETAASIKSLEALLAAQEKDVQYTRSLHERNRSLFKVGGLAREKFEASEVSAVTKQAGLEATRQKIVALETQLSYLNIKAPLDGNVGTIFSRKGDLAGPGKQLLSINSPDQKLIFRYVPGDPAVRTGQEVFINGQETGRIINIYSDAENALSVAEISVDSPLGRPNNSYVTIDLLAFSGDGCRVPVGALLREKAGARVMLYKDGEFAPLSVTIIARNRDHALIEPCPASPVAVAAAPKLSQLPGFGQVRIDRGDAHGE